ncbi:hypothetical protein THF1A12_400051 [Vibrio jasicida]|uniref:Secreted protein n=1 Tax=Vibrio jasicida TaxID=766224 RepID=A0AAU9QVI8_9VIBR|nr:hypothetical protein THF1A12_400051 [Vibrio jasicida]
MLSVHCFSVAANIATLRIAAFGKIVPHLLDNHVCSTLFIALKAWHIRHQNKAQSQQIEICERPRCS